MVRSFSPEPVPPADLDALLGLALRAPSAGNTAGWTGVVLVGPGETEPFWAATTSADWRARSSRWPGLGRAPVVVALFSSPAAYLSRYGEPDKASSGLAAGVGSWPVPYWDVDAGMAALLLLLGAVDRGLGACFLGNFRGEEALREALGVPDGYRYVGAVLIGRAEGDDPPTTSARRPRRSLHEAFPRGRWPG